MRYVEALRNTLEELIMKKNLYLIGEDIQEPYGGAFKVTKGLSAKYPANIIGVPMCEQGFTAMGIGMAYMGDYVAVEIMFGDFITLCCDQLINHAAKFYELYNKELHFVVRTPSGGYRGYGATHSQCLEKMYLGIPGVQVIAPNILCDPGEVFKQAIESGKPTLFIENKTDYPRELILEDTLFQSELFREGEFPIVRASVKGERSSWTILVYGGMVHLAMEAAKTLMYEYEIAVDIIAVTSLDESLECLMKILRTSKVILVEEASAKFGWGIQTAYNLMHEKVYAKVIGAKEKVIPSQKEAEEEILPSINDIINAILLTEGGR